MSRPAVATARRNGRPLVLAEIARGSRLDRTYLLLAALSAGLAHLGLLMDSAPVIIGAMLISPLMGPIMGLGFGLAVFESKLLRRALGTLVVGMLLAVAVTTLITLISPVRDVTPPILARVRPSLLDLFVAVFGGIAGAHATIRRSAVGIVGVAIATALMPPLAVIGFGIGTGRWDFAAGALLLFVTNAAAIALMATATARLQGFGTSLTHRQTAVQTIAIFASLAALAVPLAFSLNTIVSQSRVRATINADLQRLAGPEARISSLDLDPAAQPARLNSVIIVSRVDTGLEAAWFELARKRIGGPVQGHLLQLREDSEEALLNEERLRTRVAEADLEDRTVDRISAAVAAATGITAEAVIVDRRSRTVVIPAETVSVPRLPAASDPALAAVRAAFPDWTLRRAVLAAEPQPVPVPSPDEATSR